MGLLDLVVIDFEIMHGQATIRGTRIPVTVVLDNIAAGLSEAKIIDHSSSLTAEGIRAAGAYGALLAREHVLLLHP